MDAIMERMTDIGHPALPPHGHMRPLQMDAHDSAAASIIYQIVIIFFFLLGGEQRVAGDVRQAASVTSIYFRPPNDKASGGHRCAFKREAHFIIVRRATSRET